MHTATEADDHVNRTNKYGDTPLLIACENGHVGCARQLVEGGANVDEADKKCARLLVESGADVNKANENSETPVFAACENGNEACARLLVEHGAEAPTLTASTYTATRHYERHVKCGVRAGAVGQRCRRQQGSRQRLNAAVGRVYMGP